MKATIHLIIFFLKCTSVGLRIWPISQKTDKILWDPNKRMFWYVYRKQKDLIRNRWTRILGSDLPRYREILPWSEIIYAFVHFPYCIILISTPPPPPLLLLFSAEYVVNHFIENAYKSPYFSNLCRTGWPLIFIFDGYWFFLTGSD